MAPMTIELTHYRTPGRATSTIDGWIEGAREDIRELFLGSGSFQLSDLDPRLDGTAMIPNFNTGSTRFELKVSGPVTIEGHALQVGTVARIRTGGGISLSRG